MSIPHAVRSAPKVVLHAGIAAVLFGGGFLASARSGLELRIRKTPGSDSATSYIPPYRSRTGTQLVMVYFGSSRCAGSNRPELPAAVEALKRGLAGSARREGMSFMAIGVALDWAPEAGIEYLSKVGRFDEVAAGYNWGNSLALRYMWAEASVAPATPQVVLYKRGFTLPDSGGPTRYADSKLEFVGGAVGLPAILAWAHSGRMLPDSAAVVGLPIPTTKHGPLGWEPKQRTLHVP